MENPSSLSSALSSSPPVPPPRTSWTPSTDLNQIRDVVDNCCSDRSLLYDGHNFKRKRTDKPMKIMFYMNNNWNDFEGKILEYLRCGFMDGKTLLPLKIEGVVYTFDFMRMQQIHQLSGNWRSIAWTDDKGEYLFPKKIVDYDFSLIPLKENIIAQDVSNEVSTEDCGATKQNSLALTSKFPNTMPLMKNDNTYKYFTDLFFSNIVKVDIYMESVIMDIHKIQMLESHAQARRNTFEKEIETTEAMRGKANVVYAWYAAPKEKVESIFSHGFELISDPPALRPSLGAGIFLASLESPEHCGMQYKVDEDPVKHVILCEVVLGSVEKVELELNQTCPSHVEFDTGSDDPENPKWYAVWANDINKRIFPVSVVTCKTSAILPVDWSRFRVNTMVGLRVMLELKKRAPIRKLRELQRYYDAFKNGRTSKSEYMAQLKSIVGHQMFAKTIFDVYFGIG